MNREQREDILRAWRESARYWEKHLGVIRAMFAPVTRVMIEDAEITTGQEILDLAGGAGEPALTIAEAVGDSGYVTCTDAIREMVDIAEREARRLQLTNMRFRQCLVESLPFESDRFDRAVCRFGIMFFPDPTACAREMLRVIKPGGRMVFAVWSDPRFNPFFRIVAEIMSHYFEPVEEDPAAPGAFRFAEPGAVANVLKQAGGRIEKERVLDFLMEPPVSLEEFWPLRVELSDTLREKAAKLSAEQLIGVEREVRESAREFFPDGRMRFPAQVTIITASKPLPFGDSQ